MYRKGEVNNSLRFCPTPVCNLPAPPLHLPRHTDLQGLHRLITNVEEYNTSPAKPACARRRENFVIELCSGGRWSVLARPEVLASLSSGSA